MRILSLAIAAAVIASPISAQQTSGGGAGAEAQLRALDAQWANAYMTHDTASALALFADDIVITASNGSMKSRAGELGDIRATPGLVMEFFRTSDVAVRVFGESAVVTGRADWSYTMNGRKGGAARRYTATYVRGGPLGWRMVALHLGTAPARQP